jgi:hypothetical protein
MEFLQKFENQRFSEIKFYDAFLLTSPNNPAPKIIIVSLQYFLLLDAKKKKALWYFETEQLKNFEPTNDGILFTLKELDKTIKVLKISDYFLEQNCHHPSRAAHQKSHPLEDQMGPFKPQKCMI